MASHKFLVSIHERASHCAQTIKHLEADMISILIEVDTHKVYRYYKSASLYQYCVNILGLSEARAYDYICVARKSREVKSLFEAVQKRKLTISKARRISKVITSENATEWIEAAQNNSQRTLERIIAPSDAPTHTTRIPTPQPKHPHPT